MLDTEWRSETLLTIPYPVTSSRGQYLADYLNASHGRKGDADLRQALLLLLLSFGHYLESEQGKGRRKRARWPAEVDCEIRSRLPEEWRGRTLDALSVGTVGRSPQSGLSGEAGGRRPRSVRGGVEWRVGFHVRFVPPGPESSRIYVVWGPDGEVSAVTAAVAILVENRALHLVRPCIHCKRFFLAGRGDALFCKVGCRIAHWRHAPEGKEKRRKYMREYRRLHANREEHVEGYHRKPGRKLHPALMKGE